MQPLLQSAAATSFPFWVDDLVYCAPFLDDDFLLTLGINCLAIQSRAKEIRTRGHKWRLDKGAFRTENRRHFFTQRIVRVWNQLPSNVVEADTLGSFKKLLDEILGSISY